LNSFAWLLTKTGFSALSSWFAATVPVWYHSWEMLQLCQHLMLGAAKGGPEQGTSSCIELFLVTVFSGHRLVCRVTGKIEATVGVKKVRKKPPCLSGSETTQVPVAVRVLSLRMNFVSRSCRHQRWKNNDFVSEYSLCSCTCILFPLRELIVPYF